MFLPSLSSILQKLKDTCSRFPFVVAACLLGTFMALALTEGEFKMDNEMEADMIKIIVSCSLALPLFFGIKIFQEQNKLSTLWQIVIYASGFALLIVHYISLPNYGDSNTNDEQHIIRTLMLSAALHFGVACSAFSSSNKLMGFWNFNHHLFERYLLATLYSIVLFAGLAGALAAIHELFVHFDSKRWGELFIIIAGLFHTTFFLSGIPKPINDLQTVSVYPKGLKLFTQYVLLPLVAIYFAILYMYFFKICITWQLPKGWVSILVLLFSISGILSFLLIYPIRNNEGNSWIKIFSKWFYILIVPLLVLLFVSIGKRIFAYGITEERYIVLLLGIWLLLMSIYFIFSKKDNIILLPLSLFFIFLVASVGPWSVFNVSKRSQEDRLMELFTKNNIIQLGKLTQLDSVKFNAIPMTDVENMKDILYYLHRHHNLNTFRAMMPKDTIPDKYKSSYDIDNFIGLNLEHNNDGTQETATFRYNSNNSTKDSILNIKGYSKIVFFDAYTRDGDGYFSQADNIIYKVIKDDTLKIFTNNNTIFKHSLQPFIKRLEDLNTKTYNGNNYYYENNVSQKDLTDSGANFKLIISEFTFEQKNKTKKVESASGILMYND